MTTAVQSARSGLAAIVGEARVVTDAAARQGLSVDGKVPQCVVYPSSAEEVAAVLKCAAQLGQAVIPCRNGTKLGIGNCPRAYDVALSLKEMNRAWHYEPADLTVSVEPGMKLGDLEHFVGRHRLWLPMDPAGGPRASIGGILATNAAGPLRLCYGAPRDMVVGIKVATAEGKVIRAGGRVVKNVAGYDLMKLLLGSYGTLAVIVEASFKLCPLPAERATLVISPGSLDAARDFRRRLLASPIQPLRMVVLDPTAAALTQAGTSPAAEVGKWEIWVEAGGTGRVIERCAREVETLARELGAPVRRVESEGAERAWGRISDCRASLAEARPGAVVLKVTVPVAASEQLLRDAAGLAGEAQVEVASFGQTGTGILHLFLWSRGPGMDIGRLVATLREAAVGLGGALVIEAAPPEIKARLDVWGPPGDDFEVMRKLKLAWDPTGILSPGRFLGKL